jgi:hypothetical protein
MFPQAIFGRNCGGFDSSMTAMPHTTTIMPASRGDRKAHRRHQRRRESVERQPAGHEPKTPDDRHQDGQKDVERLHRRRSSFA